MFGHVSKLVARQGDSSWWIPVHSVERSDEQPAGSIISAYRDALRAADRLDTPEGWHVMALVHLMHSLQRSGTTSGAAALSKELRDAMAGALKGAPRAADSVDQLQARRRARILGS
jgi:hypothetical protein